MKIKSYHFNLNNMIVLFTKFKREIERFLYKIRRVYHFIPIIWKGYDFDYRYSIDLFTHQLKRTADHLEKHSYRSDRAYHASRIRLAIRLLENGYDEIYSEFAYDEMAFKYGKLKYEHVKSHYPDCYEIKSNWQYALNDAHNDEIDSEYAALLKIAHEKAERSKKIGWKIITNTIEHWWD